MKNLTLLISCLIAFTFQIAQANDKQDEMKSLVIDTSSLSNSQLIEKHMQSIGELLDPLMLEQDPKAEFTKMIPQIKGYSTVKDVGFKGKQFYVEFKNGSSSYWDLK